MIQKTKRKIIFGTDWWTDTDDCVALRLLCNAHKRGEITLTGVVIDACMEASAPSVSAFLDNEGVPLPIGIDHAATDFEGTPIYQYEQVKFPHTVQSNDECEDGVRMYRKLLVQNDICDIVEVGFPQVLADLLESKGDDISPLDGVALVRCHVRKLWIMAGDWSKDGGSEHNFNNNARSRRGGSILCKKWPTPITFLGWEIGHSVITGARKQDPEDILRRTMVVRGFENGRCSWDPMTALMAVVGDEAEAGYKYVVGKAKVDEETGKNYFSETAGRLHRYVIKTKPDEWYADRIEEYL